MQVEPPKLAVEPAQAKWRAFGLPLCKRYALRFPVQC